LAQITAKVSGLPRQHWLSGHLAFAAKHEAQLDKLPINLLENNKSYLVEA
jgi:hypothetical protein